MFITTYYITIIKALYFNGFSIEIKII